jgi:peptidoglycan/LPS O-acetylase OafA/YrhL
MTQSNKLLGLELLRFGSAIAILIWHYQHFSFIGTDYVGFDPQQQPFYGLLYFFYNYGGAGVQVFWTISGYIFAFNYAEKIGKRTVSPKKFVVSRFSRLYPLHLLTLFLVALLQIVYSMFARGKQFVYEDNSNFDFILHLFFASAWGPETRVGFNGPIWSVSIEILVYLIFFLHARYMAYGKSSTVLVLCAALVLEFLFPEYVLFDAVVFFYVGFLAHHFISSRFRKGNRKIQLLVAWLGLLIVLLFAAVTFVIKSNVTTEISENRYFFPTLILLTSAFLIVLVAPWKPKNATLGRTLESLGDLTYSSYLLHFPIQITLVTIFTATGQPVPWESGWLLVIYVSLVLSFSYATFRFFETPAKLYIRKIFS